MSQVYQRTRKKGEKNPPGVYVGRPSMWGSPFQIVRGLYNREWLVFFKGKCIFKAESKKEAMEESVRLFSIWFDDTIAEPGTPLFEFRENFGWRGFQLACVAPQLLYGKDLLCFCGPDDPCHAKVILEFVERKNKR